jgi:hypothetical protein
MHQVRRLLVLREKLHDQSSQCTGNYWTRLGIPQRRPGGQLPATDIFGSIYGRAWSDFRQTHVPKHAGNSVDFAVELVRERGIVDLTGVMGYYCFCR